MNQIKIALADDQLLFRKGLASLLKSFQGVQLLFEANNGQALLDEIAETNILPDIVIMDLNMPVLNGIETTQKIKQLYPNIRIMILSVHNEEKFIIRMLELGVNGYLFKESEPSEVEKAIHAVMDNDFYMNEQTVKAMRNSLSHKKEKVSLDDPLTLTSREKEILDLLCREFTAPEIAEKLSISVRTVEGHRNNLMQKIGAKNVVGLVVYAMKHNHTDLGF